VNHEIQLIEEDQKPDDSVNITFKINDKEVCHLDLMIS